MTKALSPSGYPAFLAALQDRIVHARMSAARTVTRELVLVYWDIAQAIMEKQQIAGWGESVVNLWRMKRLYLVYTSDEFLSQAVREMKGKI